MGCTGRVCAFFFIFCIVYYLESIGGTYIISVIQAIEKQFHIPSRWSGALISAQDVGELVGETKYDALKLLYWRESNRVELTEL